MSEPDPVPTEEWREKPGPSDPEFWRDYRVERVGGNVYLENEAGTEAFTVDGAEAYALAILAEIHQDEYRPTHE